MKLKVKWSGFELRIPNSEAGDLSIYEVVVFNFMVTWILYFRIRNSELESQPFTIQPWFFKRNFHLIDGYRARGEYISECEFFKY